MAFQVNRDHFSPSTEGRRVLAALNSLSLNQYTGEKQSPAKPITVPIVCVIENDPESDEDVFFGAITETEKKKTEKLKGRRRTQIHKASVRNYFWGEWFC